LIALPIIEASEFEESRQTTELEKQERIKMEQDLM
jgi:hypothetical protein